MAVRCLVSVPAMHAKRTYTLEEGTLDALKAAISTCPIMGDRVDLSKSTFKIFDLNFAEYVDLAPVDNIIDLARVMVLYEAEDHHVSSEMGSQEENECDASAALTVDGDSFSGLECFHLYSHSDDDGKTFVFPSFGSLHDTIVRDGPVTSAVFRQIVDILFQEMVKITVVPTRHFYNKVMIQLQEKYPQLQDAIESGMDSWRCSLRMKFKNQRRSLSNDARVAENRKKFSASRNTDDICTSELKRHKKRKMNIDISGLAGEDENSFEKHEEWLRSQAFSAAPDEKLINERMNLTAKRRLYEIADMSIASVKHKYPYLMDYERFVSDFRRMTGIDSKEKIKLGIDMLLSLARKRVIGHDDVLKEIMAATRLEQEGHVLRTRHLFALAILKIISSHVKEKAAISPLFVHEDDETVPLTPCVVYSGPSLAQAQLLHLHVDDQQVFRVSNAEDGATALMSVFFLFNIVYGRKAFNTTTVLE